MSGVNKVILLGRASKVPELKTIGNGTSVATVSLATSETWKDKATGERMENTEWHNLTFWKGQADVASKYVNKGDMIYVEGKLKTRSWEKEGIKRYATEVHVDVLQLLPVNGGNPGQTQYASTNIDPTDLPF